MDYPCPQDCQPLLEERDGHGLLWRCPTCDGRLVSLAVLRKSTLRDAVNELWLEAQQGGGVPGRPCPCCAGAMFEVSSTKGHAPMRVDVCKTCMLVWFDADERAQLPAMAPPSTDDAPIPEDLRVALVMPQVHAISDRYRSEEGLDAKPDAWWKYLPMLCGIPVETDEDCINCIPWVTYGLVLLVSIISLLAWFVYPDWQRNLAFIPAAAWRYAGLTFVTAFFLHGGFYHLFSNMFFLLMLGNNVEDRLGVRRYLLLLLLATVAGGIAHWLGDPRSAMPCVGASGGISGVIALYVLAFPHNRFSFLFWLRPVTLPAYAIGLIWLGNQFLTAVLQHQGLTHVSAFAHLGGVLAGVVCWVFWRGRCQPSAMQSPDVWPMPDRPGEHEVRDRDFGARY